MKIDLSNEFVQRMLQEISQVSKRLGFIVLIVSLFIVSGVDAGNQDLNHQVRALSTHDITMDASSWTSFPVFCQSGDILSGEFVVKKDGELYPGDQTEYDLSLLTGIDFIILDDANYDLWIQDESASPIFEMKTLVQLTWSIEIPHEGLWYIVYVNDSVYMKQVEGSIVHPGSGDVWLFAFGVIGVVPIVGIAYIFWKKRGRAVAT
jgi:hypothetical protein